MSTSLPIARVKRIIKADEEIENLASETDFLISAAAEFFLKSIAEQTLTQSKLGRKRRQMTVADVKDAVRSNPRSFGFLEPIIFHTSNSQQQHSIAPVRKSKSGVVHVSSENDNQDTTPNENQDATPNVNQDDLDLEND